MKSKYILARKFSSYNGTGFFNMNNINPHIVKAEYAVRGAMSIRAANISQDLRKGVKQYPFTEITECNIGNPQLFGQPPISFNRQVLSIMLNPELLKTSNYHQDIKKRAEYYLENIGCGVGAYSESTGYRFARENVCKFLERRDGVPAEPDNILLSDGASNAIHIVLSAMISSPNDGIMIPIPQYPLYTALIALDGGNEVPYYLREENGWQISSEDLQRSYNDAVKKGVNVKGIVIINPGNPTGQILGEKSIAEIIQFCYKNKIAILADEVYQENIYKKGASFVSFKKVMANLAKPYNSVDLFSFHSTSKGFIGECGLRGGYCEFHNIYPDVLAQLQKAKTIYLCSNTIGQLMTDLMINPPNEKENSPEVYQQYKKEKDYLLSSLKNRANIVTQALNLMKNVKTCEVEGAMYAFPSIYLSKSAIEEAKKRNMSPDLFYTMEGINIIYTKVKCIL